LYWVATAVKRRYDLDITKGRREAQTFFQVESGTAVETTARSAVGGSDEMLSLLVENVADYALFMLDPSGHIASWNKGAARIKGYSRDEIIGKHFSIFYPDDDVRAGKPEWELVVAADSGRFEDEGWRVRKDGSRFWANVVITALRDHTGTLRGFGKVTRDLTARRAAELESSSTWRRTSCEVRWRSPAGISRFSSTGRSALRISPIVPASWPPSSARSNRWSRRCWKRPGLTTVA
jgi:PAS domain S-box-containing protein